MPKTERVEGESLREEVREARNRMLFSVAHQTEKNDCPMNREKISMKRFP